ncbi:hypothetical protein CTEN210_04855 [Chaetoceros tenuissimus]|uniref:Reverse transcriptase domain-containing protein n=1 Tax=Chaetoceros tenuissimus TaxID=426638 RepID=A0AAD3H1L9_9STRA|nr:hypothetical protein CTEN210_03441 [Chaetoceros tenuissimus]GFH48374.1 hypothetical protein CTEN210_04850 [Chaetoceros tenuissimus]GFH48376.1 hypothetical protein CTEN210_04852 [Chaetoceros tenuissimus]GFH48379.1 hypothetical protein CTEN210_04855 [Chaetoceros tenuissimus]
MGYIVQQILQNIPLDSLLYSPRHFSYHDLRSNKNKPIPALRSLLGLGLNFCLHPSQQTRIDETGLETLKKDFCTRLMFAGKEEDAEEAPDLYIKSKDWEPPDAPAPCMQRLMNFEMELRRNFATPRRHKNAPIQLLAHQLDALTWLKEHPEIVVLHTDKNLGPAIMDRERYLDLAWRDHLSDRYTYQRLTQEEAKTLQNEAIEKLHYFIRNFDTKIGFDNTNFIKRMLQYNFTDSDSDDRGFSWMYLLAKIHKPKLKTRAIISYSGSLLEGLGRWVDKELKKITARLPYIAKDSKSIVVDLRAKRWPAATSIFTMDAVSMYTNIHLGHALPIIMKFLTSHPKGLAIKKAANISVSALEHALELIMSYNLFKFGDCYFLQLAGTAMGAPCAPEWATLYYCIFELDIIPLFPELGFYKRYIDDSLGLWTPLQDNDLQRREEFKRVVSTFGANDQFFKDNPSLKPLQWEVEDFSSSAVFLDLNIHLDVNGICHTSIYEKSLNLYLYIPPHSCHAPGVTKSVIFGMVHRAVTLFSDKTKIPDYLKLCFNRLVRRGHRPSVIKPLFAEAIQKHASGSSCSRASTSSDRPLVFQLPYNPLDPNRKKIQAAFKDCILEPPNEDPWSSLSANDTGAPPNINRLIVCYRRQPSLGTLLAPRKLRFSQDFSISQYYEKYQVMNPAPTT